MSRNSQNNYMMLFMLGLTVFLTVAAILLFYDTLFGSRLLPGVVDQVLTGARPILYGAFMAYLLAPAVNFFEDRLFAVRIRRAMEQGGFTAPMARGISVALVWVIAGVLVYLLASVIIPELYNSVRQLASNMESYYTTTNDWVQKMFERYPEAETWVTERLDDTYRSLETFLTDSLSQIQTLMAAAGRGMISVLNFLKNLLVGVIVSIYLMCTKEHMAAGATRILYSIMSRSGVKWFLRAAKRVDMIFSGFVRGKLLDSLIIGVLCFMGASVLSLPYAPLVSVFVGVTNIIPFFGPFIGAIPSTLLILLVSPLKALYFVVFILALQQLDGNVIGPKILGGQTGLSSLGVIAAILIGGSFFGVAGMFFGVPVMGCLYSGASFLIERSLKARNLPTGIDSYTSKRIQRLRRKGRTETEKVEKLPESEKRK